MVPRSAGRGGLQPGPGAGLRHNQYPGNWDPGPETGLGGASGDQTLSSCPPEPETQSMLSYHGEGGTGAGRVTSDVSG